MENETCNSFNKISVYLFIILHVNSILASRFNLTFLKLYFVNLLFSLLILLRLGSLCLSFVIRFHFIQMYFVYTLHLHFYFSHRITHIEYFCWSYVPYNRINHLLQKNIVPFEGPKIQICFIFNFNVSYYLTSLS